MVVLNIIFQTNINIIFLWHNSITTTLLGLSNSLYLYKCMLKTKAMHQIA